MNLAEPMTLATDYVLAALGVWFGVRLHRRAGPGDPRRFWAGAFWAMALAAFLGGTSHGFAPFLGDLANAALWRATMVAIGAAAVLLLYASLLRVSEARFWKWLLVADFALYSLWVCFIDDDFFYAIVEYGGAMLVVLVIYLVLAVRLHPGAVWIIAGIAVSFIGAGIQQAGIAPHRHFNHNDLYHVVQMVGLGLLYKGAAAPGPDRAGS